MWLILTKMFTIGISEIINSENPESVSFTLEVLSSKKLKLNNVNITVARYIKTKAFISMCKI